MNTNIVLTKNNLLTFFVKPNKGFVDHYVSSQPLSLYIPYTEYVTFVKEFISTDLDVLRNPISVYKNAIKFGDHSINMLKLFQYDVALSALTEIKKSFSKGFSCTRIFGLVDCGTDVEIKSIKFDSAPNFVKDNFTNYEMLDVHSFVQENYPMANIIDSNANESNIRMYYVCLALMGVFKLKKNYIISMEEEL